MNKIIMCLAVLVVGVGYCADRPTVNIPPGKPVTLNDCVKIALDNSPYLRAAGADVSSKDADAGLASASYYPTFGIKGVDSRWQNRIFLPEQFMTTPGMSPIVGPTYDISAIGYVRYLIYDFGTRSGQAKAARALAAGASNACDSVRQDLLMHVHSAFYRLAIAEELKVVASNSMANAANHLDMAMKRRSVNDITDADVLRAQAKFDDTSSELVKACAEVRAAMGDLNEALGLPADTISVIDAGDASGNIGAKPDYSNLVARAYQARGDLKAAESALEAAHQMVRSAKSDYAPKVYADANYGWRDDSYALKDETWFAGVTVEMTLFEGFKNNHKLDKARADYDKCEAQLKQLRNAVSRDVWNACSMVEESLELVRATATAEKDAGESLRLVSERYKVGGATMSDLLDAQTALSSAKAKHVKAKWGCRLAEVSLRRATGGLR